MPRHVFFPMLLGACLAHTSSTVFASCSVHAECGGSSEPWLACSGESYVCSTKRPTLPCKIELATILNHFPLTTSLAWVISGLISFSVLAIGTVGSIISAEMFKSFYALCNRSQRCRLIRVRFKSRFPVSLLKLLRVAQSKLQASCAISRSTLENCIPPWPPICKESRSVKLI